MKKLPAIFLLGILLLSGSGSAEWEKIWEQKVDDVIVKHGITIENRGQPYPTGDIPMENVRVFAVQNQTGDIYRYSGTPDQWTKVGNPGKKFVATGGVGSRLYGLDPAGMGVYEFTGTPMNWTQVGGPAADIYAGGAKLYATNPEHEWEMYEYAGTPWEWVQIGERSPSRPNMGRIVDYVASGGGYLAGMGFPYEIIPSKLYLLAERRNSQGVTIGVVLKYSGTPLNWDILQAGDLDFDAVFGDGFNAGAVYARDYHSQEIHRWSEDAGSWDMASEPAKIIVADQRIDGSMVHNLLYRLEEDGDLWMRDDTVGSWTEIDTSGWRNPLQGIYAAAGELYALSEAGYVFKYAP
ncbi:MAG TPA: hypothetical protein PLZ42_04890 [Methanothrix sp.]|nr:hypothetical protein [Methanothrix sp.]